MTTPLVAARMSPDLVDAVRTRYGFPADASDAIVVRFAVALAGGHPDPGRVARLPIGNPRHRRADT